MISLAMFVVDLLILTYDKVNIYSEQCTNVWKLINDWLKKTTTLTKFSHLLLYKMQCAFYKKPKVEFSAMLTVLSWCCQICRLLWLFWLLVLPWSWWACSRPGWWRSSWCPSCQDEYLELESRPWLCPASLMSNSVLMR